MEEGEKDQNPYSFKHFLKNQGPINDVEHNMNTVINNTDDKDSQQDHCHDEDQMPFPDVQKDSSLVKKKTKGKKSKVLNTDQNLQDSQASDSQASDLQDANPFSFKNFVKKDAALKTSGRVLQIVDDEVQEVINGATKDFNLDHSEVDHPSFVIEPEANNKNNVLINIEPSDELREGITKLQNENKKLRDELKEALQFQEDEGKRADSLHRKLKEFQQKENEETAALEKMVHMVEKNLDLTTQRALKAEAMTAKLKEENKSLKSNSVSKIVYDDLVKQHQSLLANVKEQARSASQQLNDTAIKAEQSLKQLYSGVDSFKLVSELLKSIDKFSDTCNNEPPS